MSERYVVVASQPGVAAMASALPASVSAPSRVLAGVLGAAALHPAVLFGGVQILLGGGGLGLVAIDGRPRQPGAGAPRPRGFLPGEAVPAGAYVAVPLLISALGAAAALIGASLDAAAGPAIDAAGAIAPKRAAILEIVARRGAASLEDDALASELLAAGGRLAGGNLTPEDLSKARAVVSPPVRRSSGVAATIAVPWARPGADASSTQVIAAADADGRFAIAAYETPAEGLALEGIALWAPSCAVPVRRGEPRVRPGEPIAVAAPMCFLERGGIVEAALAVVGATKPDALLEELPVAYLSGLPLDAAVRAARAIPRDGSPSGRAFVVVRARAGDAVVLAASSEV